MADFYELDDVIDVSKPLMEQINLHCRQLVQLKNEMDRAREAYEKAEDKFNQFSRNTLPDLLKLNGITSLETEEGRKISVVTKTQCTINKNTADKNRVADWLKKLGADHLISSTINVPESQEEKLIKASITYEKEMTMNTNSVKAYLLGALGQKESPAIITKEDIPKGINFYQYEEVEVQ